jgi:hypothetical protein
LPPFHRIFGSGSSFTGLVSFHRACETRGKSRTGCGLRRKTARSVPELVNSSTSRAPPKFADQASSNARITRKKTELLAVFD